jgi:hypothetical protein
MYKRVKRVAEGRKMAERVREKEHQQRVDTLTTVHLTDHEPCAGHPERFSATKISGWVWRQRSETKSE